MPDLNLKPCGTRAAWLRHRRRGEEPCDACKKGAAADHRARRAAKNALRKERAPIPEDALTDGQWVQRGAIKVWRPDPAPVVPMTVCRVCAAAEGEPCRDLSGHVVAAHKKGRLEWQGAA